MTDTKILKETPIHPTGELIDLAGVRIQRGIPKYNPNQCKHKNILYHCSHSERRIWCSDCERDIEPFDAFMIFARQFEEMISEAQDMRQKAAEALRTTARLRATKVLDKAWSGNVMAVACPHCRGGLLPEDFARGSDQTSREIEIARRNRKAKEMMEAKK
jgi:hypothetical protein